MAKGPDAFRTISEAAEEVGVPAHVLRFWETKFDFLSPLKRAGGRRLYRPQEVEVLKGVRALLHDQGYTIRGVQKLHKAQGARGLAAAAGGAAPPAEAIAGEPSSDAAARLVERLEFARRRLGEALAAKSRLPG